MAAPNSNALLRRRRRLFAAAWVMGAVAGLLGLALILSLRWSLERNGNPFNLRLEVSRGRLLAWWFLPDANGATSGFGNVGWNLRGSTWEVPRWLPTARFSPTPTSADAFVSLPLWPFVVAAAYGSFLAARAARRILVPGRCSACGYNTEGLAANSACPECGRAP